VELNRYLDHTLLRPEAAEIDIRSLCDDALIHRFHAVVINPIFVEMATLRLRGTGVKTCSVVGFPLGANRTNLKIAEAATAEADGAVEIDIVANLGWLASADFTRASKELSEVRRRLASATLMKVIIETPLLDQGLWPEAVAAVVDCGAEFVKTATGFFGPTPVEHVRQLSEYAAGSIKVKAAGGIRTADQALAMIAAGAARIGSSASVAIMQESATLLKK
jgi:deoxyribose-phosphate aldolase